MRARATAVRPTSETDSAPLAEPAVPFGLAAAKLQMPRARPGIVARPALLATMLAAPGVPVLSVVAPPGYGKTTALLQWAERKAPRAGWVSADEHDNDPIVLLTYVAAALDRIERLPPMLFRALPSSGAEVELPRRLLVALAAMREPVALVIDHFEAVTNRECFDMIVALALGLPPGSQLAIASRHALPLRVARLRADGGIVEIGVDDLAMTETEAAALVGALGVELAEPDVHSLLASTEGWPASVYLAAVSARAGAARAATGGTFSGDDRFMADYLRAELLDPLSERELSFLTRSSVLERMCGPLCDAALDTTGSGALLEQLERRNLLVVPLDRRREWYRYHHLLRELLLAELRRREPEAASLLHGRAAAWFEANGAPEDAIDHAQRAGDADRVARLVLQVANPVWASGRTDTVLRWMDWFEANGLIEDHPAIAVHGALMHALAGRPSGTERWAAAVDRTTTTATLADGNTMEATAAYLRALLCRDGIAEMRRDAQISARGLSPASPYRSTMLYTEAVSHLLEGDAERADPILVRAADSATRAGSVPFVPVVLVTRSMVADERGDWPAAEAFTQEALVLMQGGVYDDYWTSALVYAWAACVAARRGELQHARQLVSGAARLRPLLSYALPVASVQALLAMARAYIALGDQDGARAVLRQANDIFQQRPELGNLPERADELRAKVDTIRTGALGASSLTAAELRLLPLLPTHLSFREIGERLYVSRHTVKTQVISIYRKLGASSRSETIDRMRELGMIEEL